MYPDKSLLIYGSRLLRNMRRVYISIYVSNVLGECTILISDQHWNLELIIV